MPSLVAKSAPPPARSHREHTLADDPYVLQEKTLFAKKLESWREAKGLSRRQLADKIGVSIQQVQAIERVRSSPSHAVMILLRREMGLPSLSV